MTPDSTSDTTLTAEPDEQEIVVTRVFDAPRERVYQTYTVPTLIPEWWGPSVIETTVDEMDGDTLTIWGEEKGSPAYFQGEFSDDDGTLAGEWVYPGGGGYESTMTRVE